MPYGFYVLATLAAAVAVVPTQVRLRRVLRNDRKGGMSTRLRSMPLFSASSEADLNEMMQLSRSGFMGQTMRESLGTVNVSVNNLSNWRAAVARQPASAIEGRTCAVVVAPLLCFGQGMARRLTARRL